MIKGITVRFFVYDLDNPDLDVQPVEVSESEFLEIDAPIEYARHTVHANGVRQICLIKDPV